MRRSVSCFMLATVNPELERTPRAFFGSLKFECLHKRILLGDTAMGKAGSAFLAHYHDRNHQGLGNDLIVPISHPPDTTKEIGTARWLASVVSTRCLTQSLFFCVPHTDLGLPGWISAAGRVEFGSIFHCHRLNWIRSRPKIRTHVPT